jgi:hypothetical protein
MDKERGPRAEGIEKSVKQNQGKIRREKGTAREKE